MRPWRPWPMGLRMQTFFFRRRVFYISGVCEREIIWIGRQKRESGFTSYSFLCSSIFPFPLFSDFFLFPFPLPLMERYKNGKRDKFEAKESGHLHSSISDGLLPGKWRLFGWEQIPFCVLWFILACNSTLHLWFLTHSRLPFVHLLWYFFSSPSVIPTLLHSLNLGIMPLNFQCNKLSSELYISAEGI